ncbi:MAG: signal recognition particle-docking protein FtsY, partial [Gemmatimonadota bacterium]
RGLVGGGDTTFVYEPSPPPADTGAVGEAGAAALDTAVAIDTVPPTPAPGRDFPAAPVPPAVADSAEAGRPPDSADGEDAP